MLNYGLAIASMVGAILAVSVLLNRNLGLGRKLLATGILSWGIWMGAAWFLVGFQLRSIWLGILVLAGAYAIFHGSSQESVHLTLIKKVGWNLLTILGLLFLMGLLLGRWYPPIPSAIQVEMPLRKGVYAISQGGSNGATNPIHHGAVQSERLAIDWVKLNGWGSRASGINPGNLDQHEIFRDTVFSPIDGIMIDRCDSVPNAKLGHPDTLNNPLGNFVRINFRDSLELVLAHLQPASISPVPGDSVQIGDVLGLVGNSGEVSEPHLQMSISNDRGWAVPILIEGVFPVLNRRFYYSP